MVPTYDSYIYIYVYIVNYNGYKPTESHGTWGPYIVGTSFKPVTGPRFRLPCGGSSTRAPHFQRRRVPRNIFRRKAGCVRMGKSCSTWGYKWDIVEDRSMSVVDASFCGNQSWHITIMTRIGGMPSWWVTAGFPWASCLLSFYMLHTSCPHWTRGHLSSSGALNSVNSLIISQYHRTVLTYLDIGIYKIQRFSLWNGCFYDYSHFFPHERSSWSHLHRSLPWAYPFFSDSGMATMGWLPWPMALKFPRRISTSSISSCRRKTSPLWKRLPKKHWRPKEKKKVLAALLSKLWIPKQWRIPSDKRLHNNMERSIKIIIFNG